MFVQLLNLVGAALAGSPAAVPLVLPQPWSVDARRDKPFTWVAPGDTRQDWIESRVATDDRRPPDLDEGRYGYMSDTEDDAPIGPIATEGLVDLAIQDGGSRWDLSFLVSSVKVGSRAGDPELGGPYGIWPVGWKVDGDGEVLVGGDRASGSSSARSIWSVVVEPFSHLPIVRPAGPVVPRDSWSEPAVAAIIERPDQFGHMRVGLTASGRFEGWVKRDGAWLAHLSFELDLTMGAPVGAGVVSTSHLLIDPVDGLPVWAACLNEWTSAGREPWSELVIRERDPSTLTR